MTDPEFADATYVEPLDVDVLAQIIEREQPDAVLPTLGGQTALNLAMELVEAGVLDAHGVELIGASAEAIATAEDREQFKVAMQEIGLSVPASGIAHTMDEAARGRRPTIGLPVVIRPAYILGGRGTGIAIDARGVRAHGQDRASTPARSARSSSSSRSRAGRSSSSRSCATGPTTAWSSARSRTSTRWACTPATRSRWRRPRRCPTSSTRRMRDAAFACIRRVGVETGGSNVQFALDPANGDDGHHRDEPAGQPLERAGLQGHRLPDRQDRGPPGRRLHARRDPQRHHPQDAGQLRADHRLRRHQGAPLGVREVPGHARRARHADAVGRRGHGHRPHVPRVAAEGAALARARPARAELRPRRGACSTA